ncbi:hypothetical protein ACFLT2_03045 [Acidobacteriota bacterium]
METYTFVNIFETKGLEYLLLMAFLVLLMFLFRYLKTPSAKKSKKKESQKVQTPAEQ